MLQVLNDSRNSRAVPNQNIWPRNCGKEELRYFILIRVLAAVSKIYERILKDQISPHFHEMISEIVCGFRIWYSTQHALVWLIENWRRFLDASEW